MTLPSRQDHHTSLCYHLFYTFTFSQALQEALRAARSEARRLAVRCDESERALAAEKATHEGQLRRAREEQELVGVGAPRNKSS